MNGKHILICEDDVNSQSILSVFLEKEGYAISTASNGKTGIETIIEAAKVNNPFHLIITDIQMPVMDGLELIKNINELGFDIPVIVMTAFGDREILKELIRIGCDEFLDKPFGLDALRNKVIEVLTKHEKIQINRQKTFEKLLKKTSDMEREIEAYKRGFSKLKTQFDSAVVTYQDLIQIKDGNYKVHFAYRNKALHRLGGDYADIRDTSTGCDILIADVAGHDLAASYHTVLIKSFFDENCRTGNNGYTFFQLLNHGLRESGKNERMVTALFLRLNLETMRGEVISAGHPRMLKLASKRVFTIPISTTGTVLGLSKDADFSNIEFNLNSGDRLFLYTDGVIEAHYFDGLIGKKHSLSEEGLEAIICKYYQLDIKSQIDQIWNEIMQFCRYKPSDDMLLLAVEIP